MNNSYRPCRFASLCLVFACFFHFFAIAQSPAAFSTDADGYQCGHDHLHEQLIMQDASYRKSVEQMEKRVYEVTQQLAQQTQQKNKEELYTIPVVIHIIHPPNASIGSSSNLAESQIERGLAFVNAAFRNTGVFAGDAQGVLDPENPERDKLKSVDTNIQFTLAKQDVFGRPTSGIMRYASSEFSRLRSDTADFVMKWWVGEQNENSFPTDLYANLYLVDAICNAETSCGSVLGYAYLANSAGQFYDGVVLQADLFGDGSANSATMAHELGHYLNLRHTFFNGCTNNDCAQDGDFVCDTPPDDSTAFSECSTTPNSCDTDTNSGFSTEQNDLRENYMDYGNFDCWNTFTQGQKTRMRIAIEQFRQSVVTSIGLVPVSGREVGILDLISPPSFVTCATEIVPVIEVRNSGTEEITSIRIEAAANGVGSITEWTGLISNRAIQEITLNPIPLAASGSYDLTIRITEVNAISGDEFEDNNQYSFTFNYEAPAREVNSCEVFESEDAMPFAIAQPSGRQDNIDVAAIEGCSEQGAYALRVNSWESGLNNSLKGEIILPTFDLNIYESPVLIFDRSYRQSYSTSHTALRVLASNDCGATFEEMYYKAGPDLATRRGFQTSSAWMPTKCSEWASDTIDLSAYKGSNAASLILEVSAANVGDNSAYQWGNNLYLDNICIRESDAVASCMLAIENIEATNPSTCEAVDASISIQANESTGVEYSLNGQFWQTSNVFEGLGEGTYHPQVRNVEILSCAAVADFLTLSEPLPPVLENIRLLSPTDCGEANGEIEITASGEEDRGSLEYSINGDIWQAANIFSALTAGDYTPQVRYANAPACKSLAMRSLDAPNAPIITEVQTTNPATCKGIAGQIIIIPEDNDNVTYEYSIDAGTTWQSSDTFDNLAEGSYEPRIRDAARPSCVGETETISLIGEADSNISVSIRVSTDTICPNGWTRLIISASNGRAPYEVIYTDGTTEFTTVIIAGDASMTIRPSATTTYTLVRATDGTGCRTELSDSVQVVVTDCGNGFVIEPPSRAALQHIGQFYPNPSATASVSLDYVAKNAMPIQLQVLDITGKVQHTSSQQLEKGYNQLQLNLANLPSGTYIVKLQTNEQQLIRKIVRK